MPGLFSLHFPWWEEGGEQKVGICKSSIIKLHEFLFFPNYMDHTLRVYKVVLAIFAYYKE